MEVVVISFSKDSLYFKFKGDSWKLTRNVFYIPKYTIIPVTDPITSLWEERKVPRREEIKEENKHKQSSKN